MTYKELTDEELQEIADTYGLYTEQDVENRVSCELLRIGARNEELEQENAELKEIHESDKRSLRLIAKKGADLEKKISVLLSCKNCPENKGGYICQKEYEDKCLAQKIQYIKELQEENKKWKDEWQEQVQKENTELKESVTKFSKDGLDFLHSIRSNRNCIDCESKMSIQLNKAKELIKNIIRVTWNEGWNYSLDWKVKAEDFLKESE